MITTKNTAKLKKLSFKFHLQTQNNRLIPAQHRQIDLPEFSPCWQVESLIAAMSGPNRHIEVPNSPGIPSESFRSPERRFRPSMNHSPKKFSTPLTGIKLTMIDLKMSQQANLSFSAARCSVSIDQRTKAFESSQYVLNDKKYEIQFNFNSSLDYDYFKISQDWKRITARLEVHGQHHLTNEAVYIDAMGVTNVPYATEWNSSERSERWSGVVGIAMVSGNSKIGEVRVLIETQLEV